MKSDKINLKLTIPKTCAVKKNSMNEAWYRTIRDKKTGLTKQVPLKRPARWYTDAYKTWASGAVQTLTIFKSNLVLRDNKLPDGSILHLPISEPVVITFIFFVDHRRVVDISNLMEAPQDVLAGNSGLKLGKNFDHTSYQILSDDNSDIIKKVSGDIFYDKTNPRTEIFISSWSMEKYAQSFKVLHPDLKVSVGGEDQDQLSLELDEETKKKQSDELFRGLL